MTNPDIRESANELDVTIRAKTYIDKLAKGINPLDNTYLPDSDIVNNVRISRCLFYVSQILDRVIDNGGNVTGKRAKKENFNITPDEIQKFNFSDTPISISEIAKRINVTVADKNVKNLTHVHLTDWLISIDMLKTEVDSNGKNVKRPTENGYAVGITTENRTSLYGTYTVVLYNRDAQQFIIDNIDSVIGMIREKEIEKRIAKKKANAETLDIQE